MLNTLFNINHLPMERISIKMILKLVEMMKKKSSLMAKPSNEMKKEQPIIYYLRNKLYISISRIFQQKITMHALYFVNLHQVLNKIMVNHVLLQVGTTWVYKFISLLSLSVKKFCEAKYYLINLINQLN